MANANCPIPNNINPLSPTGFKFSISKLPDISFFCQEIALPEISLPAIEFNTPLSAIHHPGEILQYGDLNVTFLVNESLDNYMAVFNWINGLGFPEDHNQYADFTAAQTSSSNYNVRGAMTNFSDGVLEILGSNNLGVKAFSFIDLFPISLSTLNFQANADTVNYLTAVATFKYTYYKIVQ